MVAQSETLINALAKGYNPAEQQNLLADIEYKKMRGQAFRNELMFANSPEALAQKREDVDWTQQQRERVKGGWAQEDEVTQRAKVISGFSISADIFDQDTDMETHNSMVDQYQGSPELQKIIPKTAWNTKKFTDPGEYEKERAIEARRVKQFKALLPKKTEKPTLIPKGTIGTMGPGGKIEPLPPGLSTEEEEKGKTPEMLTRGELREELGRKPTDKEVKERMKNEAKGYDTPGEAFAEAQRMVKVAGPDAGLVPSYSLSPQNKYVPETKPNITLRIPPFVQGQNLPPGIVFNRKTGKYSDTTTQKEFNREELINLYGVNAAINADKMALGELTKREQLIKVFTNRIDANVPIVLDAVKEVENKYPRLVNEAMNRGQQYLMGSGKWQALQTAMLSLSNEVQRLESNSLGIGGQGQEERKVWAKIHDPNMTFKDIKILANMIQKLSKTATGVIEKQRNDLIKRIPMEGSGNEPNAPITPTDNEETKTIGSKTYIKKNGKWYEK